MSVMFKLFWPGFTKEQYEAIRKPVNWEVNRPKGLNFHVVSFDDKGGHVCDIWDSEEDNKNFFEQRLMPEIAKLGITTQPQFEVHPVHAVYAPAYE